MRLHSAEGKVQHLSGFLVGEILPQTKREHRALIGRQIVHGAAQRQALWSVSGEHLSGLIGSAWDGADKVAIDAFGADSVTVMEGDVLAAVQAASVRAFISALVAEAPPDSMPMRPSTR